MSLCSHCEQFNIQAFRETEFQWINISAKSVWTAARGGCHFCRLLLGEPAGVTSRSTPITATPITLTFAREDGLATGHPIRDGLRIRWLEATFANGARRFHVAADPGTPAAVSGDVTGQHTKENSPLDFVERVTHWSASCSSHRVCSRTLSGHRTIDSAQTPLPKRCIRVSASDNFREVKQVTLEETEGGRGQYICVTHRWVNPDTQLSSTTTLNYRNRISGSGFGHVLTHFRFIFLVAARLGIPYVWIDCLCIIQDSAQDWEAESIKMGEYYQLATFTIATAGFLPGQDLFNEYRPPPINAIARLPYRTKEGVRKGYLYVYPVTPWERLHGMYENHLAKSQLLTRGWIFQEWLLSRRIICVTPSGVFMQCQCPEQVVSNQLGEMAGPRPSLDVTAVLCIKASLRLKLQSASSSYHAWESMAELYSKMELSRPCDDRIVALQSIAKEVRNALEQTPCYERLENSGDDLIAGLWRNDLSGGLLWEQVTGGNHERLVNFPTWSWASINTAVRWQHQRQTPVEIVLMLEVVGVREGRPNITVTDVTSIPRDRLHLLDLRGPAASNEEDSAANDDCPGERADRRNFAVLHLRGRLQAVLVGARFADHETFYMAADATRHDARAAGGAVAGQRVVTLTGLGSKTRGWASIEHPAFQDHHTFSPTPPLLFALLVSTISDAISQWSGQLDTGGRYYDVFNVLFLRNSEELFNGFERVGVGRLFGKDIGQGFKSAQERDIRLV